MTYMKGKPHRTSRLQIMVSDSLRRRVEQEAMRLGISVSSYLELVVGQHISNKLNQMMVTEEDDSV